MYAAPPLPPLIRHAAIPASPTNVSVAMQLEYLQIPTGDVGETAPQRRRRGSLGQLDGANLQQPATDHVGSASNMGPENQATRTSKQNDEEGILLLPPRSPSHTVST